MEEKKSFMPAVARYPFFFVGLLVLIVGGVAAVRVNAPLNADVVIAVVGFVLLAISVAIR